MRLVDFLKNIQNTPTLDLTFSKITHRDRFIKAKLQEQFFITHSRDFLSRLNTILSCEALFDNELDLKFGDMIDKDGNYIDLKVGDEHTGAISRRSIEAFGDTTTDRHFYVCVNKDLSRIYVINARLLKEHTKVYRHDNDDDYIGELDYSKYPFTNKLERRIGHEDSSRT